MTQGAGFGRFTSFNEPGVEVAGLVIVERLGYCITNVGGHAVSSSCRDTYTARDKAARCIGGYIATPLEFEGCSNDVRPLRHD